MTGTRSGPPVVMPPRDPGAPSAKLTQRNEFVRAFVEHAAEVPASERFMVRWPTLMTVTATVAVVTIVVGVFWSLIRPLKPGDRRPDGQSVTPHSARVDKWSAVAGWDCAPVPDRGFTAEGRDGDWRTVGSGGWAQDGCRGMYATAPLRAMQGENSGQSALWRFQPPKGTRACRIAVHVPEASPGVLRAGEVAYSVLPGAGSVEYAHFTVDFGTQAGRWVDVGSFPVNQTELAVRLDPARSRGERDSRLMLGQLKVDCGG
ncbi:hypothetical protein AB0B85_14230 [Micromonospora sp. NPDC049044]|uniref:hypothetical protein n=1 Tax=Micromonospora sp. NPDC049044 TaxID=3154827 RepID=UPI0033C113FE